jgi:hypothetical protein
MFVRVLVQAVGRNCPNLADDVKYVTELLNNVPAAQGGPASPLPANAAEADLVAAIERFQQNQFWTKLGRVEVDSATYYRLRSLQGPGMILPDPNSPRVNIAVGAAVMAGADPIGDDGKALYSGERRGWQMLQTIFDEVLPTPIPWSETHKAPFKMNEKTYDVTPLEGLKRAHMRVPQSPDKKDGLGIQWCGIFAAWVWQKATGLDVKWRMGDGPRVGGRKVGESTKAEALAPGDIAILKEKDAKIKNPLVHHFLIHSMTADGQQINAVNGNSNDQRILVKTFSLKDIRYFYSVDTLLRQDDRYPPKKK